MPAAVGVTFNCGELADHIIDLEIKNKKAKKQTQLIDFFVGSVGVKGSSSASLSSTYEKIKVMQALQAEG